MKFKMINEYGSAVRYADSEAKKYELERLGYKEVKPIICDNEKPEKPKKAQKRTRRKTETRE